MITFTIVLLFVIAGILLICLVIDDETGFGTKLFQVALMIACLSCGFWWLFK